MKFCEPYHSNHVIPHCVYVCVEKNDLTKMFMPHIVSFSTVKHLYLAVISFGDIDDSGNEC